MSNTSYTFRCPNCPFETIYSSKIQSHCRTHATNNELTDIIAAAEETEDINTVNLTLVDYQSRLNTEISRNTCRSFLTFFMIDVLVSDEILTAVRMKYNTRINRLLCVVCGCILSRNMTSLSTICAHFNKHGEQCRRGKYKEDAEILLTHLHQRYPSLFEFDITEDEFVIEGLANDSKQAVEGIPVSTCGLKCRFKENGTECGVILLSKKGMKTHVSQHYIGQASSRDQVRLYRLHVKEGVLCQKPFSSLDTSLPKASICSKIFEVELCPQQVDYNSFIFRWMIK